MNIRLHIDRLVVDEGTLRRGDRDGLAQAIEDDLRARLPSPATRRDTDARHATPAHVAAISDGILARIPSPSGLSTPIDGGTR